MTFTKKAFGFASLMFFGTLLLLLDGSNDSMDRREVIKELIRDEGYKTEIYNDHLGNLTFGVGHLVLDSDPECGLPIGSSIPEERVLECLNKDIDIICADLDRALPWWRELDGVRQRVLVNMGFNLGLTRLLKFKKFLAALEKKDYETAAIEMMDSRWAVQVKGRANRLRDKILSG